MKVIYLVAIMLTACATSKASKTSEPEPPKPGYDEWAEVDKQFCDEVDACFVPYRKCKKEGKPESVCFPPHEKCVVEAYRKWKKAREKKK